MLFTVAANSQISIANSKWKGQTDFPALAEVQLEFKTDSFSFFLVRDPKNLN
jgi:hypothetical protein